MPKPYPAFPYPGGKVNLAPLIVRAFHPSATRLVDVFTGRGNLTWAAMYYRPQQFNKFWMNGVGTAEFLRSFGQFYRLKEAFLNAIGEEEQKKLGWTLTPAPTSPQHYRILKSRLNPQARPVASQIMQHLAHKDAIQMEPYVTFQGGSYAANCAKGSNSSATAWRGGVSPQGWRKKCEFAHQYIQRYRPRITSWDFKKVLSRCTSHDMVYL